MSRRAVQLLLVVVCSTTCATAGVAPMPLRVQTAGGTRALEYVRDRAVSLGLAAGDLADVVVTSEAVSAHSGVTHVYLRQRFGGVDIIGAEITVNIARDGAVVSHAGTFVPNLESAARGQRARLTAQQATDRARGHVDAPATDSRQGGTRPAQQVYYRTAADRLRLAWQVEIHTPDTQHQWVITIDAESGVLLDKFDRVVSFEESF